jgi:hypothetical protein
MGSQSTARTADSPERQYTISLMLRRFGQSISLYRVIFMSQKDGMDVPYVSHLLGYLSSRQR